MNMPRRLNGSFILDACMYECVYARDAVDYMYVVCIYACYTCT